MLWFRRTVWFIAIVAWVAVILERLLGAAPAGEVVAYMVIAVMSWIGIHFLFAWRLGILRLAKQHMERHPRRCELLEHRVSKRERTDVLRALQHLRGAQDGQVFGFEASYATLQERLSANPAPEKLEWESYQTDSSEWGELPARTCWFLKVDDEPFIAAVIDDTTYRYHHSYGHDTSESVPSELIKLAVLGRDRESARRARDQILKTTEERSVFRGRSLIVRPGERREEPIRVDFTELAPVDRESIILPESVFDVVSRVGMQPARTMQTLHNAGHRTRTAILLYGPPGTGKTLMTRHLVGLRSEATTILLHGFRRGLVREVFRLARYCQPSIVVIEDVDLIAIRRQKNARGTTALHELLDELDGLAPESRTTVIMTSNRPDVLEPALASRPGRVSQAIEIPLPDEDCRHKILKLFTSQVDVTNLDFGTWVDRTAGASPAFLEELIRRSILFAVERKEPQGEERVSVTHDDLSSAIAEIVGSGGTLTRKLLGYADDEEPAT